MSKSKYCSTGEKKRPLPVKVYAYFECLIILLFIGMV